MSGSAAEWAHPQRLADWLGHGVDAELVSRILGVPRLLRRTGRLIGDRLGSPAGSAMQMRALSLDGFALLGLAQQAGLIWHARTIVRAIDGPDVRALIEMIGAGGRTFAIRHAALAPMDAPVVSVPALPEAIRANGARCLVAWSDAQQEPVGRRLVLRLSTCDEPSTLHRTDGLRIVETLLGSEA